MSEPSAVGTVGTPVSEVTPGVLVTLGINMKIIPIGEANPVQNDPLKLLVIML